MWSNYIELLVIHESKLNRKRELFWLVLFCSFKKRKVHKSCIAAFSKEKIKVYWLVNEILILIELNQQVALFWDINRIDKAQSHFWAVYPKLFWWRIVDWNRVFLSILEKYINQVMRTFNIYFRTNLEFLWFVSLFVGNLRTFFDFPAEIITSFRYKFWNNQISS